MGWKKEQNKIKNRNEIEQNGKKKRKKKKS